jgi:hypothetical protein
MTRMTTRGDADVVEYGQDVEYRTRRRRRSGWATLTVILLVLIVIAVVADRVAAQLAEREIEAQVVAALSDRGVEYDSANVTVGGFPFLAQVASGRYEEISIDMTNVRLTNGSQRATLPTLNVVGRGIDADTVDLVEGDARVVAETVTGTGLVTFSTLQTLVDYSRYNVSDVKFTEESGALRATGTAHLAGVDLPITAVAEISVVDGAFQVRLRNAEAVGVEAPRVARDFLGNLVEQSVAARLPQLPFRLTLDDVQVASSGLTITATARDVPLAS